MEVFNRSLEENVEIIQQHLEHDRMTRFRTEFLALHHYDQAMTFRELDAESQQKVYQYLAPSEMADIYDFIETEFEGVSDYLIEMTPPYAAAVLASMYADNAVDVLEHIEDRERVNQYLHLMPAESARELSNLLNYMEETAGAIMTTELITIQEDWTLADAYQHLRKQALSAETIYYIYAVDEYDRLSGVVSLRDLIINDETKLIKDVMNTRVISVQVNDDQEEVAKMVKDYDLLALPVVGFDRELLGVITVDDVLDIIQSEADSDYSGLAAVDVSEVHENPISASKARLPWLVALLFMGLLTSSLISVFDTVIQQASVLSIFVTLITGTAGNAGTQALAVAVRQLTYKDEDDPFFSSVTFELITGVISGGVVGLVSLIIVLVWLQNLVLGGVVGVAMFGAILVANVSGSVIPRLMERLGFDPAVASGPFITTLSDLTSVYIYFSIASFFLTSIL